MFVSRPGRKSNGFTLIEILVVVSIITLIAVLGLPAVNTVLRGSQITQAAQTLSDQFALARQTALSSNGSVEVRLYQFVDPSSAGDTAPGKYRGIQIFQIPDSGNPVAVGRAQILPPSTIIDSGTALSTIVSAARASPLVPTLVTSGTGTASFPIPRVGTNYNFTSFRFLQDGSTNLSPTSNWFLTVHYSTVADQVTSAPQNFFTIQIDGGNGHIRNFHP